MDGKFEKVAINPDIHLYRGDCLDVLPELCGQNLKVDMVLADPPYGTTHCRWDAVIDMPKMWRCLSSVTTPATPVLLFGQQPFTSVLGCSTQQSCAITGYGRKRRERGF